jgi:hypothetical protein
LQVAVAMKAAVASSGSNDERGATVKYVNGCKRPILLKNSFSGATRKFPGRRDVVPTRTWGTMRFPVARNQASSNNCSDDSQSPLAITTHPHENSDHCNLEFFNRIDPLQTFNTPYGAESPASQEVPRPITVTLPVQGSGPCLCAAVHSSRGVFVDVGEWRRSRGHSGRVF